MNSDANQPESNFKHKRIVSKKYGRMYEVFGSEIFIEGLKAIDNRFLKNWLKRIKSTEIDKSESKATPDGWLIIKKLSSSLTYEDAIEMWIQSQNQLIGSIQKNEIMIDFNRQLIIEECQRWNN